MCSRSYATNVVALPTKSFNLKNTDLKNVKVSEALCVRFVRWLFLFMMHTHSIKTFIRINFTFLPLEKRVDGMARRWRRTRASAIKKIKASRGSKGKKGEKEWCKAKKTPLFIIIVNLKSLEFCYVCFERKHERVVQCKREKSIPYIYSKLTGKNESPSHSNEAINAHCLETFSFTNWIYNYAYCV